MFDPGLVSFEELSILPQSLRDPSNRNFESSVPADTNPLDRVTKNERTHYVNIFGSSELSKRAWFEQRKEPHVYALFLNFLGMVESVGSAGLSVNQCFMSCLSCLIICDSGTRIAFHLVVTQPRETFKHTPRPDFHMRIQDFPHILLVVASQKNESDRYRMLLQASCLARLGNTLRPSKLNEPVVIMAIYVDNLFRAHQHLVYQPVQMSHEVSCSLVDRIDG